METEKKGDGESENENGMPVQIKTERISREKQERIPMEKLSDQW